MPNNVFIGPNAVVAKQTASFASLGFDNTNTTIIYEIGNSLKSWVPGRAINAITGLITDKGYYFISLVNADMTAIFSPDFLSSNQIEFAATDDAIDVSTVPRWVRVESSLLNNNDPSMYLHNGATLELQYTIQILP